MLHAFIVSAAILLIGILLMGAKIFFTKSGKFPNIHIGGNKALNDKGISCATSQDRNAQTKNARVNMTKLIDELTD